MEENLEVLLDSSKVDSVQEIKDVWESTAFYDGITDLRNVACNIDY